MKLGFGFMPNSAHRDALRGFTLVFQHRSWPPVQAMPPNDRLNLQPRAIGHGPNVMTEGDRPTMKDGTTEPETCWGRATRRNRPASFQPGPACPSRKRKVMKP
jgi:hypothetical protein